MPRVYGTSLPLNFFPDDDWLENGSEGRPEVLQGIAANTRFLQEWIDGTRIANTERVAPRTPHHDEAGGSPGHDHSGGVMGRPIQRPLWHVWFGMSRDQLTTGQTNGGWSPRNRVEAALQTPPIVDVRLTQVWIPACPPGGAYFTAQLSIGVYATASVDIIAKWPNRHVLVEQTQAGIAGGAETVIHFPRVVLLNPGIRQVVQFSVIAKYIGATADVSLNWASLSQILDAP